MQVRGRLTLALVAAAMVSAAGCRNNVTNPSAAKTVFFMNITTDGSDDPQRLDMALKLAKFALEEKREVFIFFNVKGVHVPTTDFAADLKYKDEPPIQEQLAKLIEDGAVVHVCPICMKALGVEKDDLVEGASVTTRAKLFDQIGANTTAFTY